MAGRLDRRPRVVEAVTVPYALIARADDGGLGVQTAELARHTPPERVLIVDLADRGRGTTRADRYDHIPNSRIAQGPEIAPADWAWVTAGAPILFAAETAYHDDWCAKAARLGVRTVLQANPELHGGDRPDTLTIPTLWEAKRLPGAVHLPVPIARDRLAPRPIPETIATLYHPQAPAMLDRNGTRIVETAARYVRHPVRIIIRTSAVRAPHVRQVGQVTIERVPPVEHYWDAYPHDAHALLLPRRYGGLALPMQEAASLGWPIITLGLAPQTGWLPAESLVAARSWRPRVRMVGGRFDVATAHPAEVAAAIDRLATDAAFVARLSAASLAWADTLDWARWSGAYADLLGAAGERAA